MKNKFNKEEYDKILYEILNKKDTEEINDVNIKKDYIQLIDIDSLLFELISKTQSFEKYTIYISQEAIDDRLIEDYKIVIS